MSTTLPVTAPLLLELMLHLPGWLALLLIGLYAAAKIGFGGYVCARSGHSPLWALVLAVPGIEIIAIWVFAFIAWPKVDAGAPPGPT